MDGEKWKKKYLEILKIKIRETREINLVKIGKGKGRKI